MRLEGKGVVVIAGPRPLGATIGNGRDVATAAALRASGEASLGGTCPAVDDARSAGIG